MAQHSPEEGGDSVERTEKLATYDDLIAAPEHLIAEIIHGRLVTHPRPAPRHALASSVLGGILMAPFGEGISGPGGWLLVDEPELHLGPSEHPEIVVPDIGGWRRERMPKLPETAWFATAPDWACEFVSPSRKKRDRETKPGIYASFGVQYYWLGDASTRSLETFVLKRGIWERTGTFRDKDEVAAPPFAKVPFSLGRLWPD